MSVTIIAKSDQINSDDLISGPKTITVTGVKIKLDSPEQPVDIFFQGDDGKPFRPCKTMRRVIVAVWGGDANAYAGQSMTLYRDPDVKFGGMAVGGIRISHMTGLQAEKSLALMEKKGKRAVYKVRPLVVQAPGAAAPTDDRAAAGAQALADKLRASDHVGVRTITADDRVIKQRAWLAANRPELAALVDAAVSETLALFETPTQAAESDGWPGPATDAGVAA